MEDVWTGSIPPPGWKILRKGKFEGVDFNNPKLYYYEILYKGEEFIDRKTMLQRALKIEACGSLKFILKVLALQKKGVKIFPEFAKGLMILMPWTLLEDRQGRKRMPVFYWSVKAEWKIYYLVLEGLYTRGHIFVSRRTDLPVLRQS